MKKLKLFATIILLLAFKVSFCDMIPPNSHYMEKCVKITNLDEYANITLLAYTSGPMKIDTYKITSTNCLSGAYKFTSLTIYAVKNSYLKNKSITSLDLPNDKNALKTNIKIQQNSGYISDSDPTISLNQYYKIAGFTDTSVVIYLWKEEIEYNNGAADETKSYNYEGDVSLLYQDLFPTNIETKKMYSSIELSPNPTKNYCNLIINNFYNGSISAEILSIQGKKLKTLQYNKTGYCLNERIYVYDLPKGTYIVKIFLGDVIESKKLIID